MAETKTNQFQVMVMNGTKVDLTDPKNLSLEPLEHPGECEAEEVLIQVHAFAFNPVDYKINTLMPNHPTKYICCSDAAGVVTQVGSKVERLAVGDSVYTNTFLKVGTAASMIKVPQNLVSKYFGNGGGKIDYAEAAGVPLVAVTALDAVASLGDLEQGAKVIINGASGGVGLLAVQMCRNKGYDVTGICSGKNADLVKSMGASEVINYREQDFGETETKFDGFIDCVGGKSVWDKGQRILKQNGPFITIVGDDKMFEDSSPSVERTQDQTNAYQFIFYNPTSDKLDEIAKMISTGKLKVRYQEHRLGQVHEAMKALKSKTRGGVKVVVSMTNV